MAVEGERESGAVNDVPVLDLDLGAVVDQSDHVRRIVEVLARGKTTLRGTIKELLAPLVADWSP